VNETALLSAVVFFRHAWETVAEYVSPEDLTAHGRLIWESVGAYYRRDPDAEAVLPDILISTLERDHPRHAEDFAMIVAELSPEYGSDNIVREVLMLKRDTAGEALQIALSGRKSPEDMRPLLDNYLALNSATGLLDVDVVPQFVTPLSQIIERSEAPGARWKLLPMSINALIRGGVLPGHCIVVFGRVNAGKSAFAINATAGFLKQGATVLYVENEDLIDDTAVRLGCRLTGWTRDDAAKDPAGFEARANERGFGRLILNDPAPETPEGIEKLILTHRPDICVVNQARNLTTGAKDSVAQMDQIAKRLRNMGKRHRVVMLLVTAAKEGEIGRDGTAMEKPVLEMADCYSSRTGVPAVAEVMIGYGVSKALQSRSMACLSLCKSKLSEHTGRTVYVQANYANGYIK